MASRTRPTLAAPLNGTPGNDALTARWDGDRLFGFGGDDRLSSLFNHTYLSGGYGRDILLTDVFVAGADYGPPIEAVAEQFGASGDDRLTVLSQVAAGWMQESRQRIIVNAGQGNDVLRIDAGSAWQGLTEANGGGGDDRITVSIADQGSGFATGATTTILGGAGNDSITFNLRLRADFDLLHATSRVTGDDGDDVIFLDLFVNTGGGVPMRTEVDGGAGNDRIDVEVVRGTNHSVSTITNRLLGGAGNDSVAASIAPPFGDFRGTFLNQIFCGDGIDSGRARITAVDASDNIDARNLIDGGAGDDWALWAVIEAFAFDSLTAVNTIRGAAGNDSVSGRVTADVGSGGTGAAHNFLRGGAGDDTVAGVIEGSVSGWSRLYGDAGNDTVVAIGGSGNLLDGGTGNDVLTGSAAADRMVAGLGDDAMDGGGGADNFQFFVARNEGRDTITGFQWAADVLVFTGLADGGAAGLEDDLDAITEVEDQGAGGDVVVRFDGGSVLVFAGRGTGSVDSLADLVSDPLTQLTNNLLV